MAQQKIQLKKSEQEALQDKSNSQTTEILKEEIRYLQEQLHQQKNNKITGILKLIQW